MGDDGAGLAVLSRLQADPLPDVKLIELGTGGINLVHELAGLDRAIIIDAADFGGDPGEIRKFKPDEVRSLKTQGYSLHDWDLFTTLDISKKMGELPDEIIIFAIQVVETGHKEGLSPHVVGAVPEVARMIRKLILL